MRMIGALLLLASAAQALRGSQFGPAGCARVSRSAAGTCVLSTKCKGRDTSRTEFAFLCTNGLKVQKHSFGRGGFDELETYDTQVACEACDVPPMTGEALHLAAHQAEPAAEPAAKEEAKPAAEEEAKPAAKDEAKKDEAAKDTKADEGAKDAGKEGDKEAAAEGDAKEATKEKAKDDGKDVADAAKAVAKEVATAAPPKDAVKYGPDGCVSTYLADIGTCVVQTQCSAENLDNYNVGLVCVEANGQLTRHLFGKGSFLAEETFDTLITCKQCLGLDDIVEDVSLAKEVADLRGVVGTMKTDLDGIKNDVAELKKEVGADSGSDTAKDEKAADDKKADTKAADDKKAEETAEAAFVHAKKKTVSQRPVAKKVAPKMKKWGKNAHFMKKHKVADDEEAQDDDDDDEDVDFDSEADSEKDNTDESSDDDSEDMEAAEAKMDADVKASAREQDSENDDDGQDDDGDDI